MSKNEFEGPFDLVQTSLSFVVDGKNSDRRNDYFVVLLSKLATGRELD